MSGDTGEKTEEATPEKLRKAKEEGQVPKSQDFVGALGFAVGFFVLVAVVSFVFGEVEKFTREAIEQGVRDPSLETLLNLLGDAIPVILKVSLPIGVGVFIAGVFSNVIQTGFFLAFKVLNPKLDKINPINGLKGLFKVKKFVELIKNIVKMSAAGWLAWNVMENALADMTLAVTLPLEEAVSFSARLVFEYLVKTIVLFVFIGVLDLIWSRRQFNKEQMMSKYDVKQEYKQMEGDPQMKGQRKQLAHELLFGGGAEAVKNADAVVVNPAHIAVAIKYDDDDRAPKVVAKGMRVHAEKIKELAKQYGVPILRNVPLAQALNKLDVDEEVPEELYEAVAEVLSFVYKIREEQEAR
ncbi:MAG: EscU/YscU/HrcU family type III secretion system export apparatus switch protein, partial [Myxococcota bacterium]